MNEKREEQEPILAVEGTEEGLNRSDEARGYDIRSLNSIESSKSSEQTIVVNGDNSTNGFTPYITKITVQSKSKYRYTCMKM